MLSWSLWSMAGELASSWRHVTSETISPDSQVDDVQMCTVDCGEWTDLCAAQPRGSPAVTFQPITVFPSILLLRPQESPQQYGGTLGSEALHRFIML